MAVHAERYQITSTSASKHAGGRVRSGQSPSDNAFFRVSTAQHTGRNVTFLMNWTGGQELCEVCCPYWWVLGLNTKSYWGARSATPPSGGKMRAFAGSVAVLAVVLGGCPVLAADMAVEGPVEHWQAFAGVDANSSGTVFGYSLFQYAPGKGGVDETGLRFWLLGADGGYHYTGPNDEKVRGTFWDTDALIGYSFERDDLSVAFYGGLNAIEHRLSVFDPTNPVQGSQVGAKFRTDAWYNPTPVTLLYGEGTYSTAFGTYWTSGKFGYSLTGGKTFEDKELYVGPQITLHGDDRYQEWRIGGHLTSFNLGKVDFEIAAGYQHNTDHGGGGYALLELNSKF
jgi:Cellulose biosynthesis protein BcsS